MALDNDKISPDLNARVEMALNSVTIAESEFKRLTKLSQEMEAKIAAQNAELREGDSKLLSTKSNLDGAIADYQKMTSLVTDLEKQRETLAGDVKALQSESEQVSAAITKAKVELALRESAIELQEKEIAQRHLTLTEGEKAHKTKVEKLQAALA